MELENKGSETQQESNQSEQLATQVASTERASKNGGPRTPQGKQRSSQNSFKHGFYSREVSLNGKSRTQYNALLRGLWNDYEPRGTRQQVFVEKLALLLWSQRRVLSALVELPLPGDLDDASRTLTLDLLLRWLTTTDRAIDRILIQLEPSQSISRGQPVQPTLNVNLRT
ncbi:MAG: hypothetical protein WBL50_05140 [Candidatus Acidiferrum sp.]